MSNTVKKVKHGLLSPLKVVRNTCKACNKPLVKLREDKKFCDDKCRGIYNNKLASNVNNLMRNVNNALRKNRRILESLLLANEQSVKVSKDDLLLLGFQFKYHTHSSINKKGGNYSFCYEYGYLALDHGQYLIVKQKNLTIK